MAFKVTETDKITKGLSVDKEEKKTKKWTFSYFIVTTLEKNKLAKRTEKELWVRWEENEEGVESWKTSAERVSNHQEMNDRVKWWW